MARRRQEEGQWSGVCRGRLLLSAVLLQRGFWPAFCGRSTGMHWLMSPSFSVRLLGQASCTSHSQACCWSLGTRPFPHGCGAGEGSCCWDMLSEKAGTMPFLVSYVLRCHLERRSVCLCCAPVAG